MYKRIFVATCCAITVAMMLISIAPQKADARAGSSRSIGSRGSRSYATPTAPPRQSSPYQQATPQQPPQPAGGGFFRNMAGGIAGGVLGGMLFRSLGLGNGWGDAGSGGIGILEMVLILGIIYLLYRFLKNRRESAPSDQNIYRMDNYREPALFQATTQASLSPADNLPTGIAHIRQFDPAFDEQRFCDQVLDIFFKIQSAWMNRDLAPAGPLLTPEVRRTFQDDIDRLLREKRVNRLENIAVRNVEMVEAWQESGQDYITTLIYANLVDYTTDDSTGQVVAGSKTEPVKFEEYWTLTRPAGDNQWRLSAIGQK